jgi:hypothetical protein
MKAVTSLFVLCLPLVAFGYTIHKHDPPPPKLSSSSSDLLVDCASRRSILFQQAFLAFTTIASAAGETPLPAFASEAPTEFKNVGVQSPTPDGESPFRTLENGVKIKDFRPGTSDGAATVAVGSRVSLQMTGRLLNLNGVPFYDTRKNDPDGFGLGTPLTFVVGDGNVLPGLESGIMGMKKNQIRRIIVPPELGYTNYPGRQPVPFNDIDQRALDSVIKNPRRDATLLFDVKVERIK